MRVTWPAAALADLDRPDDYERVAAQLPTRRIRMRPDLLILAADLVRREEPFALATVVRRQPASSAQSGDTAIVTASGDFHGWLGGSCTQPTVVREALRALADGKPRLIALSPDPRRGRAARRATSFR